MNEQIRTIRISLIVIFTLFAIGTFLYCISLISITVFGVGWSGKDTTLIEIIWLWKGVVLLSFYSLVSSVGLVKKKKIGIIFGYTVPIGLLTFFFTYGRYGWKRETPYELNDILWLFVYLGIPVLIILGLTKIKNSFVEFKKTDYITSGFLTILLLLSFYSMFD